jgi:type I restriction enzyme, S subunit
MNITANLDYETSERSGAGGHFQVIFLKDDDGNDITELIKIGQGRHFSSVKELQEELSTVLKKQVTVDRV